ncbi:DUF1348 family protein [Acidithiobacillus sulfuriphilus]
MRSRRTRESKPATSPFTPETAAQKVRMAEEAWNSRDGAMNICPCQRQ